MTQSRFRLTANPDSKAEGQQQTTTHPGEQQHEERSTRRTRTNADKQALTSPPFGMPSKILGPFNSSRGFKRDLSLFVLVTFLALTAI